MNGTMGLGSPRIRGSDVVCAAWLSDVCCGEERRVIMCIEGSLMRRGGCMGELSDLDAGRRGLERIEVHWGGWRELWMKIKVDLAD